MDLEQAVETQLKNIETRTGKKLEQLVAIIKVSGLEKHGQIRDYLKSELGMGHGDANTLTHYALESRSTAPLGDPLDEIYIGAKADLRPIHEDLVGQIRLFGEFEIAPKKGYVSLRRKKQFAMIGPATKTEVEIGLNAKGLSGSDRLVTLPPGGMCNYKVRIAAVEAIDAELVGWLRAAYDSAG
ncbi:MAG: DUF4287 domain-containing protein [Chthonomonas sp.]|nr:DUF4287 domain-containing protein [Chthonomonas sp.]